MNLVTTSTPNFNKDPDDTSSYSNFGPPVERGKPRCGHCGRFLKEGLDDFDRHIDKDCPVGGIFVSNNRLKVNGEYRQRAS